MTEKGSEGRGLRERILNLKEQRISSGNSTWDDCEPIVYLLKRDVLAALDAEAAQQTPHAAGGEPHIVAGQSDIALAHSSFLNGAAQTSLAPKDKK